MAVDSKVIRVHLWRFSALLAGICFKFVQMHPYMFGTLSTLFILYVFFPMALRLLIYSSPIMICAYAYRKNVLESETKNEAAKRNVINIIRHPPNQVAPLEIARSEGASSLINTDTDDLRMPGSAPSVLLPSRSPFDLPYDPFEERPNLTADSSFEQMPDQEFCRHESFFLGPERDGNSRNPFTDIDEMEQHKCYGDGGSGEAISPGASSASLNAGSSGGPGTRKPAELDSMDSEKEDTNSNMHSEDLSSYLRKSLGSATQETAAKGAKENGHGQSSVYIGSKDLFNVHKRALHTPAHSIASDLVVEISEAGSPPLILSPPDGDSSSQYDGDVDRDVSSGSEDISMHVYRVEDGETRSYEGQGFAHGESIPVAVELEPDSSDGYEHSSPTSSDENSSYEDVVHHLNKKLKARCLSSKAIMETPEEPPNPTGMGSGVEIGSIISNQTNPMSGVIECSKRIDDNFGTEHHEKSELCSLDFAESAAIISQKHFEESLVGSNSAETSAEALPVSDNLNSDDEINGLTENHLDFRGSSATESSESKMDNDPSTLEDPSISLSSANNEGYQEHLDNISAKSSEPPRKLNSQNEAPLPDADTELHVHRITETCM